MEFASEMQFPSLVMPDLRDHGCPMHGRSLPVDIDLPRIDTLQLTKLGLERRLLSCKSVFIDRGFEGGVTVRVFAVVGPELDGPTIIRERFFKVSFVSVAGDLESKVIDQSTKRERHEHVKYSLAVFQVYPRRPTGL